MSSKKSIIMNSEQKQIFLEFFKLHPNLMNKGARISKEENVLWSQLAEKLNNVPGAVTEDWEVWRSSWADFYSTLKIDTVKNFLEIDESFMELLIRAGSSPSVEHLTKRTEDYVTTQKSDHSCILPVIIDANPNFKYTPSKDEFEKSEQINEHKQNMSLTKTTLPINFDSTIREYDKLQSNLSVESTTKPFSINNLTTCSLSNDRGEERCETIKVIANDDTSKVEIKTGDSKQPNSGNNRVPIRNDLQPQVKSNTASGNLKFASTNDATVLEKAIIKKIAKADAIKLRYMKLKLKMEGNYHKRKLGLMKQLVKVKQRKVKAEEKQATALISIAKSLGRMLQTRP